jgi:hypothetical protein
MTSDLGRTFLPLSISRAIKTLLAYRALDICCYVLKLAPERKRPASLNKPNKDNTVSPSHVPRPQVHQLQDIEILDAQNWAKDILAVEQLLEALWAQPSVDASSSTSASSLPSSNPLGLSTSTYPVTSASNSAKEQIIQSMAQNMNLSNSGRRSEKVHRFLASFHEVTAVMGYIISHVRLSPLILDFTDIAT